MSTISQDNSQWLSATEETLFLHDGLIRVSDLVELPHDVNKTNQIDQEVLTFDSKNPTELCERLMNICGTRNNAYARLLEYRLNALRGFWNAQHEVASEQMSESDQSTLSQDDTLLLLKKQGLLKEPEQAPFSTRISLLLVLPLLQSQSKFDQSLCGTTAELLCKCLGECPPFSLNKEPKDCLNGIQNLLSSWLGDTDSDGNEGHEVKDYKQRENIASALVALACAGGHLETFIHTVHLLQNRKELGALPVGDMLFKLLQVDGGLGQPTSLLGNKHVLCWGYEDMLSHLDNESLSFDKEKEMDYEIGRSATCDGKFLFLTNPTGRGLIKMGSGVHGTLRGYIYAKNSQITTGCVAWGDGHLVHRPTYYDKDTEANNMLDILDECTLKPYLTLVKPAEYQYDGSITTVALISDGTYFYWLWCQGGVNDKRGAIIYLDVFRIDSDSDTVVPLKPRVVLLRKEEPSQKSVNESLLSRLRPYRSATTTATLVALSGADPPAVKKDESCTSCGVPLKILMKTPIYTDGTSLVLLSPTSGASSTSTARSLFVSGTTLNNLRLLAMNLCFNVDDGQFNSRTDLLDVPTCALARGASVLGMAVCYDAFNNMIWTCNNDWVDQYINPGHQARHHVLERLGCDTLATTPLSDNNRVSPPEVITQLLQHVGSMCIHRLNHEFASGSLVARQPVRLIHLQRGCDIMAKAVAEKDKKIIICALIILQTFFKMSKFEKEKQQEIELLNRMSKLVWHILWEYSHTDPAEKSEASCIQREVCNTICTGLTAFYSEPNDRNNFLHKLLTEGDKVPGLTRLRNLILVDYADQLRNQVINTQQIKSLRLTEDLVHYIYKIAVKESCILLRRCQTTHREEFERILSSVPMASPCLRYLMALQSHLLREIVLFRVDEDKDKERDGKTEDKKPSIEDSLQDLQTTILCLASEIFKGAYEVNKLSTSQVEYLKEVLEVLLETCNVIINSNVDDLEYWLQGLERVSKATILGHLLPVMLTGMTHTNLRCLTIADTLMPQLVQLVILTSQAALLLKSQVQAIRHDDSLNLGSDTDISELLGEAINVDSIENEEQEEEGFLAGLKIPAPWTTGKTIESIHPVRDNYKFKETVQIPGARCLYLRFDPRCASQYDYDKFVVYSGNNTNSKKVAEYGGNTFGYGSRSVLGSGWPKDLIKVDGDIVTFSFEMRSGREHNTPDKAMWGFLVTVRAQESTKEVSCGLPFLADLALGLSVLACTHLQLLYQGPEKTKDEEACQHLLKSKLLQRCVWQSEGAAESGFHSPVDVPIQEETELSLPLSPNIKCLPRIRMPSEIVKKLRELSLRQPPQMRQSMKEVLKPEILEESILSTTIKHLSLSETVRHLTSHEINDTEEFNVLKQVCSEVYRRLYAMIRQLQAIAELEQKWSLEVADVRQGLITSADVFFIDYHLVENKSKDLAILCFLKDLTVDSNDLEKTVSELREKLDLEVALEAKEKFVKELPKTRSVVCGLLERLNLLLQVTIAPESGGLTRSVSHMPEPPKCSAVNVMVRSDTDVFRSSPYNRSYSAPQDVQDDSILDIIRLQKKRQARKKGVFSILQNLIEEEEKDRPPHVVLIDQLFSFIGSSPEKAVSSERFLAAASRRLRRGSTRQQALVHMKELLTAATRVGGATHLVAAVTSVLQTGPRIEELTCGGMASQVREAFSETMTSVVQLSARYPIACCNSIGLLCIIPYTRAEEKCLVRCGLVHLLDKLCSVRSQRCDCGVGEVLSTPHRVSSMAWAGFQVLSNRCVSWEQEDGAFLDELEHSGLARQVSTLLTNHLARATESSGNEAAGNEALQEVLSLLNNLSRSRMGKAILSQPACVSRLLSLLLDQRPSPKLVLIILQLCRVALPLMSAEDCDKVELPTWGQDVHETYLDSGGCFEKPRKIASLLLAKLGDFLVPGGQTAVSSRRPSTDHIVLTPGGSTAGIDKDKEDSDVQDGRLSVVVHKREDQSPHEVIQALLSTDSRPFRLTGGANMENVVRMDREMTKNGKAEVTTEDAMSALRRAAKWAQAGLVVSTGSPLDNTNSHNNGADKKKRATEVICKDKNSELARTDPVRPFISGHVANSMATEVIALLHSLLTAPETLAAHTWATAVEQVISNALSCLPVVLNSLEDVALPKCNKEQLMAMSKQANAALAALGGFDETVKPGCDVQIIGDGLHNSPGQILSVSDQTGLGVVQLLPASDDLFQPARYSDTVQVPITRLRLPRNKPLPLHQLSMTESIVIAVQSLLLSQNGTGCPLAQPMPIHGIDGSTPANQVCRVVAEIRARACKVLWLYLKDPCFASEFIQHSSASIKILKSLSKECAPGDRLPVIEGQWNRLRLLYRDCAKPPPPPSKLPCRQGKEIVWKTSLSFPPVRACMFSHGLTAVTFLGDPSAGSGLPRGTIVYATQAIPQQAPSFYWELEICSLGDPQDESGPMISFGFMPSAEKKDGVWTNPVGTCLFHNNGRAVHYNGSSLLQWRSVRLDVNLNLTDIAGIGWERQGDLSVVAGQAVRGIVYFTHNGRRLPATIDDVAGGMWPVVHIQKKNTRVRANFGGRQFAYTDGARHRNAADDYEDLSKDIRESFCALPFHFASDSDSDGALSSSSGTPESTRELKAIPGPPCRTITKPKLLRVYNSDTCVQYKRLPCYENFTCTGPDARTQQANQDIESDVEDMEDNDQVEDHYVLLVKAWEQKVFPTIRRRFRNEAERKDGLEQIRGALQLGMTDIARQTVEFLYEENGGMPRDLHLPTLEDIKEELSKFNIERVRKGIPVVICSPSTQGASGATVLPKYSVRGMLKTFGLTGIVLDVDQANELVQVETYLRSEGVLVRYWYPIDTLERPPQGYRKSSIVGHQSLDTSSIHIHRELLRVGSVLVRMECRAALLELISRCNSPDMQASCSGQDYVGSTLAACAATLQELDVENLQLLSNHLLAWPQPHGSVRASSLVTSPSPTQCISSFTCCLSDILYHNKSLVKEELRIAISRAAVQGEDYLIELSSQICMCLQTAPEMFPHEEFPVTDSKMCTDVYFPGAAFLVVSCKSDPNAVKKDTSLYKSPWARIFTYRGQRVKKSGQASKQEVVCYPCDTSSSSNHNDQYPPVIVPTDLIHLRIGVSPPPGIIVCIHAIPPQLPLAMIYIETLVSEKYDFQYRRSDQPDQTAETEECYGPGTSALSSHDTVIVSPAVLLFITELLGGYLWKTHIPALLKEYVFHLLAQTIRVLHISENALSSPQPCLSRCLVKQLHEELKNLYDEESKHWPCGSESGSEQGRFSTYLQTLVELYLAIGEVVAITPPIPPGRMPLLASDSMTSLPTAASITLVGKRKKLKAKRERDRSTRPSGGRSSESDTSVNTSLNLTSPTSSSSSLVSVPLTPTSSSTSSSSGGSISTSKPEDMLWFHRALTLAQILRHLVHGATAGTAVTGDAVVDAAQTLTNVTAHSRLLVLTGLPTHIDINLIRNAIIKTCSANGGLFMEELYLPVEGAVVGNDNKGGNVDETVSESKTDSGDTVSMTASSKSAHSDSSKPAVPTGTDGSGKDLIMTEEVVRKDVLKGYAVVEVRSKTKLDGTRQALYKCKTLVEGVASGVTELALGEMFQISTVNQSLFADTQENDALENYFLDKLVTNRDSWELSDMAMISLTEIFHSCFISEQKISCSDSRHESGYICLGKEQIMQQTPGNLMYTFCTSIRAAKRTFLEQINYILRRYGINKTPDKEDIDKKGKSIRKSAKPSKEKLALGATGRAAVLKERRLKVKEPSSQKPTRDSSSSDLAAKPSKEANKEEEKMLTLDGFLSYVVDKTKQDVRAVWRGLFACGFDLHFERCCCIDVLQALNMCQQWNLEKDCALVHYVNKLCHHLAISPTRLHPHELYLAEAELSSATYSVLQGVPVESLRLRFALLQSLNNTLEGFFFPLVDFRPSLSESLGRSTASLLASARGLFFFDTKMVVLNRILNATAQRKADHAAPEITLDPLENVGGERKPPMKTNFSQAYRQLSNVPSSQLRVRPATGGDPTYSFNVRFTGEEVHGTSGSFRHFLWQVGRELESSVLDLCTPCPSSAAHKNKGKFILKPGPMTYSEEKLLQFFGQLLAVSIRADIPLGLDLMPIFWKNLVGVELDPATDLQETDILTYSYIKKFELLEREEEKKLFSEALQFEAPRFVYTTLNGSEQELIADGRNVLVNWENKQLYADSIRQLRMKELKCEERMTAVKAGVASIVPLQLIPLMCPADVELRTCGLPYVDLNFIKEHTMYQVGLMETDLHIQYFWAVLESFSQDDLRKFIKFACNQERLPQVCPCRDGGPDTAHVPPFPMKIAPPDGPGSADSRHIRVETCMFMIKLPQYSNQELMRERLLYVIHCREDPLSG